MTAGPAGEPPRVVVLGGGIAAVETVLALRGLAGEALRITLVAPGADLELHTLGGAATSARDHRTRLALAPFVAEHGGRFRRTAVLGIDTASRAVQCADGGDEPYEVLIVAVGAIARPAFAHASTCGPDPAVLAGLLLDLEAGWSRSVAFVVPAACTWPQPLYELALATAAGVRARGLADVRLHLVTPETEPLELLGPSVGAAVAARLDAAAITFHGGAAPVVERARQVRLAPDAVLHCDRILALPVLHGPRVEGLPVDEDGFVPVDRFGRVAGLPGVYAVGDAAGHRVKHDGVSGRQADVVAGHVAAAVGADVRVEPYEPVRPGRAPAAVGGRFLEPYLERHGLVLTARGAGER